MTYAISETRDIPARAQVLWDLVSDLPNMGELSPENAGGEWKKGTTGPAPGAMFVGKNRNGVRRWKTTATVVECEPAEVFEIAISSGPVAIANWRYEFTETDGGCRVVESWVDHRPRWMRVAARPLGRHDGDNARVQMSATLANLAQAAERSPLAPPPGD